VRKYRQRQFSDLIKAYLTYRAFFSTDIPYGREKLKTLVAKIPATMCLCVISQLLAVPERGDSPEIRRGFIRFINDLGVANRGVSHGLTEESLKDYILYTPQGLMMTAKWILAYGVFDRTENVNPDHAVSAVIYLNMIVSDYLGAVDEEDLPFEVARNAYFNKQDDFAAEFIRTLYIVSELAPQKELFDPVEYLDINQDFVNHYGYTIWQYAAVIFGLFSFFIKKDRSIDLSAFVKLQGLFKTTEIAEVADRITADLVMGLDRAKEWAVETLDKEWDFVEIHRKPFLVMDGDAVIPLSLRMLYTRFFLTLKFKIQECYPIEADRKKFLAFYGRLFEVYIEKLIENSMADNQSIKLYPEFEYAGTKSPDMIVKFGAKSLLVIEAKAHHMRKDSIFEMNSGAIWNDVEKMIIEPTRQVRKRLSELLPPNPFIDLCKIQRVYVIVVNLSGIPLNPPLHTKIKEKLSNPEEAKIVGELHLSVDGFERVCGIIEHPKVGSIFNMLDRYLKESIEVEDLFFIEHASTRYRASLIKQYHEECFQRIKDTVGFDIEGQ